MKIKIFLLLTFLIFSSFAFSACGKNKDEESISSKDISNSSDETVIDSDNIIPEEEEVSKTPEEASTETTTKTAETTTSKNDTTVAPAHTEKTEVESTPKSTVKAESTTKSKTKNPTPKTTTTTAPETTKESGGSTTEYLIIINKSTNKLHLYNNKAQIATYPIATGRDASLTPEGKFTIVTKAKDPSWRNSEGEIIPGGIPENPLGDYWLGLSIGGGYNYGIHGTNNESSIGNYASGGCIRMYNNDVAKVYSTVPKGSEVWIGQYSTLPAP